LRIPHVEYCTRHDSDAGVSRVTPDPAATDNWPVPTWQNRMIVPIAQGTELSGGTVKVVADAPVLSTVVPRSAAANVYVVPLCAVAYEPASESFN
jgi:hypothetical protein